MAGIWLDGGVVYYIGPTHSPSSPLCFPILNPEPPYKHIQAEAALFEALAGLVERAEERVGEGHIAVPKPTLATHAAALEKVVYIIYI